VLVRPSSIRDKLRRILMVSLVLVLVLVGLIVSEQFSLYRNAQNTSRIVNVTREVQELVHSLQKERGLTNGLLGGSAYYQASVSAQRMKSDAALVALNGVIDDPAASGTAGPEVRDALGKLVDLSSVREAVDSGQVRAGDVFAFYTEATRALNDLDLGLDQAQDASLRHGLQALYALGDVKDYTDWERGLLNGVFSANTFQPGQYPLFAEIRANRQNALASFDHFATPAQRQAVETVLHSRVATMADGTEQIAVQSVAGPLTQRVDAQNHWWDQTTLVINDLRTAQQSVGDDVAARAEQLQADALRGLGLFLLLGLVALGLEVALVIGTLRSIIGPLSTLASHADDVATTRLPEAVAALENSTDDEVKAPKPTVLSVSRHAGTEIRQVGHALGRLQNTALALASEQAMIRRNTTVSLANLGRRNQNLVRRQLGLISDFEREELDPSALANMFELDHLATRMRRNAESLLVLVDESSPRPWSKPLPIVDVVRAAISEVEDYRRVSLKRVDDVYVAGAVVTELAHMLAELVENGLSFSPPDVEVEIYGRRIGNRYTIAVVDHGAGMHSDALVRANARLHDEENFLVAPTKFLGHYVVGRLARRLGVDVNLAPAPITGITARLVLPPEMLTDSPNARVSKDPQQSQRPGVNGQQLAAEAPAQRHAEDAPAQRDRAEAPAQQGEPAGRPGGSRPSWAWSVPADGAPTPAAQRPRHSNTAQRPERAPVHNSGQRPDREPADQQDQQHRSEEAARQHESLTPPLNQRVRVDVRNERTRNGLVKRQAKTTRPQRVAAAARPPSAHARTASETPAKDRTPSDISAMLSNYRAGHQRGAHAGGPSNDTGRFPAIRPASGPSAPPSGRPAGGPPAPSSPGGPGQHSGRPAGGPRDAPALPPSGRPADGSRLPGGAGQQQPGRPGSGSPPGGGPRPQPAGGKQPAGGQPPSGRPAGGPPPAGGPGSGATGATRPAPVGPIGGSAGPQSGRSPAGPPPAGPQSGRSSVPPPAGGPAARPAPPLASRPDSTPAGSPSPDQSTEEPPRPNATPEPARRAGEPAGEPGGTPVDDQATDRETQPTSQGGSK
jgi:signal transduction histidine kinase